MNYFSNVLLLLCILVSVTFEAENYTLRMAYGQFTSYFSAYIAEFNGKRCYVRPDGDIKACQRYCKYVYEYVPALPYKNAKVYNPKTRLCQPQIYCPKQSGVGIDDSGKCFDYLLGIQVAPVDAPVPTYKDSQLVTVTVICQHGKVKPFNGKVDCQCQLGYGTLPVPSFGPSKTFKKCNQKISIVAYFPNFMKIYYDEEYDNMFPHGAHPNYWILLMLYYLRKLKYRIVSFFVPYQVQLITLTIPLQLTFKPQDWIWFTWFIIFFVILFVVTMFQKCVQTLNQNAQEQQ